MIACIVAWEQGTAVLLTSHKATEPVYRVVIRGNRTGSLIRKEKHACLHH